MRRALLLCAWFIGCAYQPVRTVGLGDGEIRATAVRADGAPAAGALVALQGSARVTAAGEDGGIVLTGLVPGRWLVRITEDDDGDGAPERGALVPVDLRRAGVPKNLTDGCTGAPKDVVTSVLLGDVPLETTGAIVGNVTLDQDGGGSLGANERARVVVWRDIGGFATQIEASAGVDGNGDYRIDGVVPGFVHVAAFVFDAEQGATRPKLFALDDVDVQGGEALLDLVAGQPANLTGDACAIADDCASAQVCVVDTCVGRRLAGTQIEVQWTLPEPAAVELVQFSFTAPGGGADVRDPDVTPFTVQESARAIVLDPPIGVVDILLTSATSGAADGLLRGAVIIPDGAVQGPVELPLLADPCDFAGVRDCDHDGIAGLPLPASDDDPAWAACTAACAAAFGIDGAHAKCGELDCDDDGDGQPDVTEPLACLGPGVGTDLDADGLCEPGQDPFPYCAADDLAGCPTAFVPPASRY